MRALPRLLAAAIALTLALAGGAIAEESPITPDTERFWILLDGCGDSDYTYLSNLLDQPTDEGVCGSPWFLNDVIALGLTADEPIVWTYPAEDGFPFVLDADGSVSGSVFADNWGWVGAGSAEMTVTLTGLADGQTRTIGSVTEAYDLEPLPDVPGQEIPFAFEIEEALSGLTFTSLALDLSFRGINSWHGFVSHDYTSHVDVPVLVPAE